LYHIFNLFRVTHEISGLEILVFLVWNHLMFEVCERSVSYHLSTVKDNYLRFLNKRCYNGKHPAQAETEERSLQ